MGYTVDLSCGNQGSDTGRNRGGKNSLVYAPSHCPSLNYNAQVFQQPNPRKFSTEHRFSFRTAGPITKDGTEVADVWQEK